MIKAWALTKYLWNSFFLPFATVDILISGFRKDGFFGWFDYLAVTMAALFLVTNIINNVFPELLIETKK